MRVITGSARGRHLKTPDNFDIRPTTDNVKEAVFKAVAPYSEMPLDLRKIESLRAEDGHPYVHITEDLAPVLASAGIRRIHISITHEKEYATAFAVAED